MIPIETSTLGLHTLKQYEPLIGPANAQRISKKADELRGLRVVHVSSTYYGGGVAEILTPLTLMMNAMGIETGWHMIQGTPAFFSSTKKIHNALQGEQLELSEADKKIYEQVVFENALRFHFPDCDTIIVHDPQPLPLVRHFPQRKMPWIWQCHVDLSCPNAGTWDYLRKFTEQYDVGVFSLPTYAMGLDVDQRFFTPAINPFSPKNREMSDDEINDCLNNYRIPTDRPLIAQISRFDKWKDPLGVIEAFRKARKEVDGTLVLVGNDAVDDPEAAGILESINSSIDEGIIVLRIDDSNLVNALQRRADVVLQKSIREGFGLTVTEAMWKGAVVVGGNVGGIRQQITDGDNGFLVDTIDQAAQRIVQILTDHDLRQRLSLRARETVRQRYLMSRLLEDWIDLLSTFH